MKEMIKENAQQASTEAVLVELTALVKL